MSKLTLFGLERSVYTRIARLALFEKRVDYALQEVDIFVDGGPPAYYLDHNPFGTIPSLLHENFRLYETGAITRYVDETFAGPALQPAEPMPRARMNQIIGVLDSYAYRPLIWDLFVQRIVIPENGGESDEGVISAALQAIAIVLEQLEFWIDDNAFLAGRSISLADLHGFPMFVYFVDTPEGAAMLGSYPRLQQWLERMRKRPCAEAARSWRG
jgi:glutathione S-transferase